MFRYRKWKVLYQDFHFHFLPGLSLSIIEHVQVQKVESYLPGRHHGASSKSEHEENAARAADGL